MHISQSGVSAQIRQLERDLGAELFDRSARTATLTAAGAAALEHARAALASAEAVRPAVDDVTGLVRGRLAVGMVTGCTITPLFDALAAFHRPHPGVEIHLVEDNSDRLGRTGARRRPSDLALVGPAEPPPTGLESLTIVSERLVAAVPVGHPLAKRQRVTLRDLCAHPIVCMPAGHRRPGGVRPGLRRQAGCTRRSRCRRARPGRSPTWRRAGLGIGVLSESLVVGHESTLHPLAIAGAGAPAVLALVWRSDAGPALRQLLDRCRSAFDRVAD